jgi:hypothetical protein
MLKDWVLRWLTRSIVRIVPLREVIVIKDKRIYYGGKAVDPAIAGRWVGEAKQIQQTALLPFLRDVLSYGSQELIATNGTDTRDLWTMRAMRLSDKQFWDALKAIADCDYRTAPDPTNG